MSLQPIVQSMMRRGILIDQDKRAEYRRQYEEALKVLQSELNEIVGFELNVESAPQMKRAMHETLKLPTRSYKGRSTLDEDALVSLIGHCETQSEKLKTQSLKDEWKRKGRACLLALKIRKLRKRIESYLDARVDNDGRMRWVLVVGGTETGRFSCKMTPWDTGLNGQTIPLYPAYILPGMELPGLRGMFISDPGCTFLEFDLERGETWVYAHLAEEPTMLKILYEGLDFHKETAKAFLNTDDKGWDKLDEITQKRTRYLGKRSNHALSYLMTYLRLATEINQTSDSTGITVSLLEAGRMHSAWTRKYDGMPKWWDSIKKELETTRRLVTPYGRVRTFYQHWGPELFKEATAYKPQSTSVDYLNVGMSRVHRWVEREGRKKYGAELLHQNHDSLEMQCRSEHVETVIPIVRNLLHNPIDINGHLVAIPVEAQAGPSWGDLKKVA